MIRERWLLAALTAAGCGGDPFPPIELDLSVNCPEVLSEPWAEDIGRPGGGWGLPADSFVLAAAADGPGTQTAWILVIEPTPDGDRIVARHGPDTDVARVELPVAPSFAGSFTLEPGPIAGQAWAVLRTPGRLEMWWFDARSDNPQIAYRDHGRFPTTDPNATSDWHRDLVFIAGRAHVVAVPPFTETARLNVYAEPLDESLSVTLSPPPRPLQFEPQCDNSLPPDQVAACEAAKNEVSFPLVQVVATSRDPRSETAVVMLRRARSGGFAVSLQDVATLTLGYDADGQRTGLLRTQDEGAADVLGPYALASDGFADYLQYTIQPGSERLMRFPASDPPTDLLQNGGLILESADLVQLDRDIALSASPFAAWDILKVFPDDPTRSMGMSILFRAPVATIDQAGPGNFLIRLEDGSSDLVELRCRTERDSERDGS